MASTRKRRKGLRVPVSLEVRCEVQGKAAFKGKVVNLSTEGMYLKTDQPIDIMEKMNMEFLLPGTLNSVTVVGEVVWNSFYAEENEPFYAAGIKFAQLEECYLELIREYSLTRLYDENLVRSQGILQLLEDIRNLPSLSRLKAYHILIKKGAGPLKR